MTEIFIQFCFNRHKHFAWCGSAATRFILYIYVFFIVVSECCTQDPGASNEGIWNALLFYRFRLQRGRKLFVLYCCYSIETYDVIVVLSEAYI